MPREHDIDLDCCFRKRGALVDDEHATLLDLAGSGRPAARISTRSPRSYREPFRTCGCSARASFLREWQTEQNRRFGDLFLLADPGYEFVTTVPHAVYTLGEHGYDPATPEMMGIFLAAGPDFRRGVRLAPRENRTLHDLLARLLHLNAPERPPVDFGLR